MTDDRKTTKPSYEAGADGPLVSVLISTYNRPAYLAEALESVFRQTYQNFEIVLVRDGGMPVHDVVRQFSDSRLHFIDRDQNRGLPYSFNEALSIVKGDYICYLGDDDKYFPHHIGVLMQALEQNPEFGAVYSDLYKAHCRVLPDGRRRVLAKNVEISRDFDRMLMFQFNHALHVSLMHRRDLLEHAGNYNENLNVLIDWDLTHRICFYTDFLHVPVVTGEYYAPVGQCDRISVQRRKNVNEYLRNLMTIRTTRPPQPWTKAEDLSILILTQRADEILLTTVREIWSHTFYPNQIYVPLTRRECEHFKCSVSNVIGVQVEENDSLAVRLARMLMETHSPLTAIITAGIPIPPQEAIYLERSVNPLMSDKHNRTVYQIKEAGENHFGVVGRTEIFRYVFGRGCPLSVQGLRSAGLEVRPPRYDEYPFQFDNLLCRTELMQIEGQWEQAAKVYDYLACHRGNKIWMRLRQAYALYQAGRYDAAAETAGQINQIRPTVASYLIEARARRKLGDIKTAIRLNSEALAILTGQSTGLLEQTVDTLIPKSTIQTPCTQPEETLVWT